MLRRAKGFGSDNAKEGTYMAIKAVLFDIYGTLIDIETDENDWSTYLNLAKYLGYRGINLSADEIRWFYFEKIRQQIKVSNERYPEIDMKMLWCDILTEHERPWLYKLNLNKNTFLKDIVALYRALTRKRLRLYDYTLDTLKRLKNNYRLGIVSDAQHDFAIPELKIVGIHDMFDAIIISGDYGYRKPDQRLFNECLSKLGVLPSEAIFIGNDTYRDMGGAKSIGMRTALFMSQYGSKDIRSGEPDIKIDSMSKLRGVIEGLDRQKP